MGKVSNVKNFSLIHASQVNGRDTGRERDGDGGEEPGNARWEAGGDEERSQEDGCRGAWEWSRDTGCWRARERVEAERTHRGRGEELSEDGTEDLW
jgi:hypothetical protein